MTELNIPTRGFFKLDDHRIIDPSTGKVMLEPGQKKLDIQSDRYHRLLANNNRDYFEAPKKLGSIDRGVLLSEAQKAHAFADAFDGDTVEKSVLKSEAYELAASALHELAYIDTVAHLSGGLPAHESVEDRLRFIDTGNSMLSKAIYAVSDQPMSTLVQRLELKIDFENVLKDIVCGEITPQTVEELLHQLESHLYRTYDNVDSVHARGLGGEIRMLIDMWSKYYKPGDTVAIPATVRGDSGYHHPQDTHDIDCIRQKDGTWENTTPIEVKRRKVTNWMLRRYTGSDLMQVRVGGDVQLVQAAINPA